MTGRPTFLIIGAQKAGTTWLADMLRQHPEVSMPERKELHFFDAARDHKRELATYLAEFEGNDRTRAVGEATPNYVWVLDALPPEASALCDLSSFGAGAYPAQNPDPAQTIAQTIPDVRLVVLVRDPIARAVSAFRHHIRMRRLSPRVSILGDRGPDGLIRDRFGIIAQGFYDAQLNHWFARFDRSRVLVLSLEDDVLPRPREALRTVCSHLGVDPDFAPVGIDHRSNASTSDPYLWAHYVAPRLARSTFRAVPMLHRLRMPRIEVEDDEITILRQLYAPGVQRLSALLERDFPTWDAGSGLAPRSPASDV